MLRTEVTVAKLVDRARQLVLVARSFAVFLEELVRSGGDRYWEGGAEGAR